MAIRPPPATGSETGAAPDAVGFLTDATLCIGCKACEVACKQWNQLPSDGYGMTGFSYDNSRDLGAETWRHVLFSEQAPSAGTDLLAELMATRASPAVAAGTPFAWLMVSDVCKHCVRAGCLLACPTGAIIRTEFDTVYIRQDVCNGCGYCVPACPFGVPQLSHRTGTSRKCTLCYDRLGAGLEPACAKACPTDSIVFGPIAELLPEGRRRVERLRLRGVDGARLYGDRATGGTGGIEGLNAFFVLTAPPETYNLPAAPRLPQSVVLPAFATTALTALGLGIAAVAALRRR